jgi:RNA-directed DNA polymerase
MILDRIAEETGVNIEYIKLVALTASHRYRTYTVQKRTGGYREINHPTPELKYLQRWMARKLLTSLPVHDAVTSYRKNVGVVRNAEIHVRQNYLLKVDFQNFFPSITDTDIERLLKQHIDSFGITLSSDDIKVICGIVCRNGALTIGAPSSPTISNAILYDFDKFVFQLCEEHRAAYSRYADDLFISTNKPDILSKILMTIRSDLESRESPSLVINNQKTVFTSRKRRRVATGLVLTSDRKISIGRSAKRRVRSLVYLYGKGALSDERISFLRGYISYLNSVEPDFVARLRSRYGDELLDRLNDESLIARKAL